MSCTCPSHDYYGDPIDDCPECTKLKALGSHVLRRKEELLKKIDADIPLTRHEEMEYQVFFQMETECAQCRHVEQGKDGLLCGGNADYPKAGPCIGFDPVKKEK